MDTNKTTSVVPSVFCFAATAAFVWAACVPGLALWVAMVSIFIGQQRLLVVLLPLLPALWVAKLVVRACPKPSVEQVAALIIGLVLILPIPVAVVMTLLSTDNPSLMLHGKLDTNEPFGFAPMTGVVYATTASEIPPGWLLADGRTVTREEHPSLFQMMQPVEGEIPDSLRLPDYRGMILEGPLDPHSILEYAHHEFAAPELADMFQAIGGEGIEIQWLIKE